jgi:hypothetical protein
VGPTGIVTSYYASALVNPVSGNNYLAPTAQHTAGAGETALVWISVSCGNAPITGMDTRVAYSTNNGTSYSATGTYSIVRFTAGDWGATTSFASIPLTSGTAYRFAAVSAVITSGTGFGCYGQTQVIIRR